MKSRQYHQTRRGFLKKSILTGALFPLVHADLFAITTSNTAARLKIHIFSKHLQFLNYRDMANAVAELGFDGIDLTVRPKGHVLPERVEDDLPKAIDAIRKVGLVSSMMVTAVDDATDPTHKKVLDVAAKLGIRYYRMNWFSYPEGESMPASIQTFQQKVKEISQLNKELGLTGCYQNHAGRLVGASLWELWQLLKEADKQHMGIQYDIRHAVVEGGTSWQNGLRLIHPHIKTLAIKDFNWEKKNGKWDIQDTPIGEGMVDFKTYFKLLKQYQINVPVSLHLEYPLGGAESGATQISCDQQVVFKAMKKDLQKVHELWEQA
ncbi:MAG TPA: sugar phosphate isomerase/epimerase family protein [Flavitalea sp.]|nr:sugar phosphate isomerase/epimerase family protein [Flavitalea sp.]